MKALGFAAVVCGEIDPRTVSSDYINAMRLALFWVFNIQNANAADEGYLDFLWSANIALHRGRNPANVVEIQPVTITLDTRAPEVAPPPHPEETPGQRVARLLPKGPSLRPSLGATATER